MNINEKGIIIFNGDLNLCILEDEEKAIKKAKIKAEKNRKNEVKLYKIELYATIKNKSITYY